MSTHNDASAEAFTGTRPVAPNSAFDQDRLIEWMHAHVPAFQGPVTVDQFKGGQSNPTYLLTARDRKYVLRRKPAGDLLPSAHAVDREYRVLSALAQTDVPVPRVRGLCEDPGVIGAAFYVMDHVDGRILWDPALGGMAPAQRSAIYDELNRVQAALHCVDPTAIGLADYGRPGSYLERQVARWTRQYRASETETIDAADRLIEWLAAHRPSEGQARIVHGDYRIDNVIFHPAEPRIVAVLDWELSTLGDPLVDFAYHCLIWHMSSEQGRGLAGRDLSTLGIPTEKQYVARYLERTGRTTGVSDRDWTYYLIFNMFRLVGILQGVARRAQLGNASSAEAETMGRRARPLAELAWSMARQLD